MKFIVFFFIYFLGLGSYLSALSPYADQHFGEQAYWIYLAGQMGYPLGYLVGGYLSDRLRLLRPLLLIGLVLLVPAQWLQFSPDLPFPLILTAAICNRMLLAVNLQLASIALLESAGPEPFSRIRSSGTLGFAVIQCALWVTLTVMDYSAAQPFPFSLSGKTGALFFVLCLLPAARIQIHRISHERYNFMKALRSMNQPAHILFLLLSFFYFFAFQLIDNYVGAFFDRSGGGRLVFLGWFLAVIFEIPFLFYTAPLARRFGIRALFLLAAVTGVARFSFYSAYIMGIIDTTPMMLIQLIHGIQFMSYYMGAIFYLKSAHPDHLYGSVHGLYFLVGNALGGISGNIVLGHILNSDAAFTFAQHALAALDLSAYRADVLQFLPVFGMALGIEILVGMGFLFLRSPALRSGKA